MSPIRKDSITDQVYEYIQRQIETGKILPGQRIQEQALADLLSISKTPLRLALHQLKQDGIVRIESRQGIYLASPTREEFFELLEMREVLEGLAARRAAARASRSRVVEQMRACIAPFDEKTINTQRSKYASADHRFHRALIQASESSELIKKLGVINLRLHMNRLRTLFSRGHDLRPIHREHIAILKAIEAGDAKLAEKLARAHVHGVPWQKVLEVEDERPKEAAQRGGRVA